MEKNSFRSSKEFANSLLSFLDDSPTAGYCVKNSADFLKKEGFKEIKENEKWNLKAGDKFYLIRHETALVAGIYGNQKPSIAGFRIIGSHTDSPGFKLKPKSVYTDNGYIQLSLEVYGGPMYSTWTDRDLSCAGRVVLETKTGYEIKLVKFEDSFLRIPQLAIHYNREANKGFTLNPQTQLCPILGLTEEKVDDELMKKLIADKLEVNIDKIINYELELFDTQKSSIGGLNKEFIIGQGIDNKSSVHSSLFAIANANTVDATVMVALFDNEEVGSGTTNGGKSSFIKDILKRVSIGNTSDTEQYFRAVANSYFISDDGAHAIHPNYKEKFDTLNKVFINKGPVIKINASTFYASTVESSAVFEMICKKSDIPYQKFVNRSDIRGGGTIGSMIATNIGMRTVDIGNALIAMHSVREMCGVEDHYYKAKALEEFFKF